MPLSKRPSAKRAQLDNLKPAPPAPKANKRRVTHGGRAQHPKRQAVLERQIRAALPVRDPTTNDAPLHDVVAVSLLAVSIARLESCCAYTNEHGMFFKDGRVRPSVDLEQKLTERCANLCDRLGLTPRSRAALGLDIARAASVDLAQLLSGEASRTPHTIEGTAVEDD